MKFIPNEKKYRKMVKGVYPAAAVFSILIWAALASNCFAGSGAVSASLVKDRGHLVLVGGGEKPGRAVDLFIKLAQGDKKQIIVFPLASENARETGEEDAAMFAGAGAKDVRVMHIKDRTDAVKIQNIEAVLNCGGVWFSGGDQNRITEKMLGTPLLEAVKIMKAKGGVAGGTSAGTACQSDPMITGEGDMESIKKGGVVVAKGLGLIKGVIVDQHFIKRQRENRLFSVVIENPSKLGIGIDEDTSVWIKPDKSAEVMGEGSVMIIDARKAGITCNGEKLNAFGIRVDVLTDGQTFKISD